MSAPIPARDYVVSGLISEATVNALLAFGEPMVTEDPRNAGRARKWYRAWVRYRAGGRTFGPWHLSPQLAAEALLEKLSAGR